MKRFMLLPISVLLVATATAMEQNINTNNFDTELDVYTQQPVEVAPLLVTNGNNADSCVIDIAPEEQLQENESSKESEKMTTKEVLAKAKRVIVTTVPPAALALGFNYVFGNVPATYFAFGAYGTGLKTIFKKMGMKSKIAIGAVAVGAGYAADLALSYYCDFPNAGFTSLGLISGMVAIKRSIKQKSKEVDKKEAEEKLKQLQEKGITAEIKTTADEDEDNEIVVLVNKQNSINNNNQ